jgi:hypothetical protein
MQLFSFPYHKGINRCSTIQQNSLFYIIFHSIYHISVRGVREELQPFTLIFYFFLSIFSNKIDTNVRNPPSHPSHFLFFFFKKTAGNPKNTTVFFRFPATFLKLSLKLYSQHYISINIQFPTYLTSHLQCRLTFSRNIVTKT